LETQMTATVAPPEDDDSDEPAAEVPDFDINAVDAVISEEAEAAAEKLSPQTAMAAYQLKIRGANYLEIAELLGYMNADTARAAVHRVIASLADPDDDGKALRQIESARIEGVMKAIAPRALHRRVRIPSPSGERGDDGKILMVEVENDQLLPFGTLFLKAVEQHSRLHGVVAPQQLQLLSPDALEIERTVTALVAIATRNEAHEADILLDDVDGVFQRVDPPEAGQGEPKAERQALEAEQEEPDAGAVE
jgi:hypothetical protein